MATAFLGPRGTFSEDAALAYAGRGDDLVDFATIPALTAAVETGLANEAVLPIENSIEGSISATLDLLIHETPLKIKAELVVPVRLFLITAPGATLSDIKIVSSHPNPLGQSRRFLERCLPRAEKVASLSTALAVEEVVAGGDRTRAAIGTERSAALFGGQILAHDIQDVRANVTRFVVLGQTDAAKTGDDKTSIGFTIKANVPGALSAILAPLADEDIQMTKVESRPTKAWLGDYVFLIDFEGHREDPPIARALERIRDNCAILKVFGSYPRFPLETLRHLSDPPAFPPTT
jgi:prephenate dehydratase